MRRICLLFIIILFITITSCTKETTETRLPGFETPTITGFILMDETGVPNKTIGVPNIKLGSESNDWSSPYYFTFYPNPCVDRIFMHMKTPADGELKKIWIVSATFEGDEALEFIGINNALNISVGGSPLYQAETTGNSLGFDVSLLPEGYYRIYLKVDKHLLYNNLIIYRSK